VLTLTGKPNFKRVVAWALYDWGNSAFALTVMAVFFPLFYSSLSEGLSAERSQFWFNITLAGASLLVAFAAPVLGAIADRGGSRKRFLAAFAAFGVVITAALASVHAGQWWLALLLYGLGTIGFSGANVFYDSMLVDVARREEYDMVSAFGYAVGYVGGGLLLAVNALMFAKPSLFGLASAEAAMQASFVSVALWWAVFTLPLLWLVKETPTENRAVGLQAVRSGLRQLVSTAREIRRLKVLVLFLVTYWLYIDGVNTVIKTAVFFGDRVLGLPQEALVMALLVTQFVAFPAALFFGWLGQRLGPKVAILIGLGVYVLALVYAWRWLRDAGDFYKLAIAIGLVQGGVQSLSRSLYARLIPVSKTAEFFGFYNMVGKFAAILGPLLMALTPLTVPGATERDSILAVSLLFLVGGLLLSRVNVQAGGKAARLMEEDAGPAEDPRR